MITRLDTVGIESSPAAALGSAGLTMPFGRLMRQSLQVQANEVQRVAAGQETQKTVQASLEARFNATSGVQIDQELSDMTQLQTVYTANARVLTAVKDMFDILMRM